jgi:nucleoside-diphosphate-sugar epimerase
MSQGETVSSGVVVLGASGGIGRAVVAELASKGIAVRAVTRTGRGDMPSGVEHLAVDLATPEGARVACEGAATVYHCAQPAYGRWAQDFPRLNACIAEGVRGAGAKLVFADNLYMFGPVAGPIHDGSAQEPTSKKGRVRKALADALLADHAAGRLRVTIGRASDYFGPRGSGSVAGLVVDDALAEKKARWPARADVLHTFSYLPDVARGLVTLGSRDDADGSAWILPAGPPLTASDFVQHLERALGRAVQLSVTSKVAMRVAGLFIGEAREIPDIWYQFEAPFVADASRFESTFGPPAVTPVGEALEATVAWYRAQAPASGEPS